jgi:alpha-2-macroglobulin
MKWKLSILLLSIILIGVLSSCDSEVSSPDEPVDIELIEGTIDRVPLEDPGPLERFPGVVRESQRFEQIRERPGVAEVVELLPEQLAALLQQLEPLVVDSDDEQPFALRPDSEPPPRTGVTRIGKFPPEDERQLPEIEAPDGPPRLLRYAPEGEVPIAGQITLTFDRPMVAVTAHDDAVADDLPVHIEPDVPGKWRWAGTRTLIFEPDAPRLPMATRYEVVVKADLAAADGNRLGEEFRWHFQTPPLNLTSAYPSGSGVELEPVMLLSFDQRVDPETLIPSLKIFDGGNREIAYRLATDDEIGSDSVVARQAESRAPGSWIAIRPEQPLPGNSRINLVVEAGAASAEGLLLTTEAQRRHFNTYGPLFVRAIHCGWWARECTPTDPFRLEFTNALSEDQDLAEHIRVEPGIPGMDIDSQGHSLNIAGLKHGQTTYTVFLDKDIVDRFGQPLTGVREFHFEVGSFPASLGTAAGPLTTLDPHTPARFDFFSTNLADAQARIYRVDPSHWSEYLESLRGRWQWRDEWPDLPGELVFNDTIDIDSGRDELTRTGIDLEPWLEDGLGHLLVLLRPGRPLVDVHDEQRVGSHLTWIQATQIGIDAMADHDQLLVWASHLADGRALDKAEVRIAGMDGHWLTGENGLARVELRPRNELESGPNWISVQVGRDSAVLPESRHGSTRSAWHRQSRTDQLIWQVFDDRRMYRPGEQVHLKGWIRHMQQRPDGGLGLPGERARVRYRVMDSRNNELHSGEVTVGHLGGFDLSFDLPDTPNLGSARVQLDFSGPARPGNTRYTHTFSIEEFRTPEFEVSTRVAEGPFVGDQAVEVEVEAAYYAGGALPGAETTWRIQARPGQYTPPEHDDWSFGFQPPWWFPWPMTDNGHNAVETVAGRTDATGRHAVAIAPDFKDQPRPMVFSARATVMDVNRQAWSASSDILAHPGEVYVGLKTDTYFVDRGEPLVVDVITTGIDGELVGEHPVRVELSRVRHHWRGGQSQSSDEVTSECRIETDEHGLGQCRFQPEIGGQYRIFAVTEDDKGRTNASRIHRWVGGGRLPAADRVEMEEVMLIPDRDHYKPGQTARLLVQAPFEEGEGLLTLRRHGLAEQHRFSFSEGSTTLEIGLRREWLPNVHAHVVLIGQSARSDNPDDDRLPPRPAIATGTHQFDISTAERSLSIDLVPREKTLAPGESTEIELRVLDADGQPVSDAEIALVVVDEAILALTDYRIPDPLDIFYRNRPAEVRDFHLRPSVRLLSTDELLAEMESEDMQKLVGTADGAVMERAMAEAPAPPEATAEGIDVREDFNPLAAFEPALVSDAEGRVSTTIQLPDNLTRYRITAVAVSEATHYGKSEAIVTARLPLMVRPSAPRFLNFGDRFEFPVVLQNQTDQDLAVRVAMEAANLDLTGSQGYRLEIPANDRVEVRFPAAARQAGTARFQVVAVGNGYSDAARGQLPVWTPATSEAFATYGQLDDGAIVQPVIMPEAVWPQFGQLEITTSSTAVQSLTDAFIHLHDYPYQASEPVASRILAIVALRDILEAFEADGMPDGDRIEQTLVDDLARLASLQNPDGGFGLWRRGQESWPYPSLHVAHALVRARHKQYDIDDGLFERTMNYVRDIERRIPVRYGQRTRDHIIAYALYIRTLEGDRDRQRARALVNGVDSLETLSFESLGWLLGVLSGDEDSIGELARLRRFLGNRVTETAAGASFATSWRDGDHLIMHSNRRADGIILEALMIDEPESDLIPKLVHDLQAHRVRGRWPSTQDNAFVLLALDQYFRTYEAVEPDFFARTWLGEDFAGEHRFAGRTTERHHIDIPMQWLAEQDEEQDLTLAKDGAGRMYYRIGLRYAPKSLNLEPASHGFEVSRVYRALERDDDVVLNDDGVWEIRAGARVEVELTLVAPARRHHVALVDPIPAGLEPLNPALAVSDVPDNGSPVHPMPGGRFHWWGPWYEHQNLRNERVEAFTSLLPGGVYRYSYYARATTPGEFIVPPTRAEEMYQPETFGRGSSARVVVKP